MTAPRCMITGAVLVNEDGSWQACDLFRFGEVWIVNANEYVNPGPVTRSAKALYYRAADEYFERRGVYVFTDVQLTLSAAAADYMLSSAGSKS